MAVDSAGLGTMEDDGLATKALLPPPLSFPPRPIIFFATVAPLPAFALAAPPIIFAAPNANPNII